MSNRIAVEIKIGGKISSDQLDRLALLLSEEAGPEYGLGYGDQESARTDLGMALEDDEAPTFFDDRSQAGYFPKIETYCEDIGLQYFRSEDGGYCVRFDGKDTVAGCIINDRAMIDIALVEQRVKDGTIYDLIADRKRLLELVPPLRLTKPMLDSRTGALNQR